jgi:hypothetical protein
MRIVTVSIDLVIDDTIDILNDTTWVGDLYNKDKIVDYLNDKLYTDPEFFGDFGPENIINIKEIE